MRIITIGIIALIAAGMLVASSLPAFAAKAQNRNGSGGNVNDEKFGNCLSFPVIWAEGVSKILRGISGTAPILEGHWWYWWGTDLLGNPLSCHPDPDNTTYCDDNITGDYNVSNLPGDDANKVYMQQDKDNTWQAGSTNAINRTQVDLIDWGDNLESVNWNTNSKVRTEVVLLEDSTVSSQNDDIDEPLPMLQYEMRHLYGLGIDEMWGISTDDTHVAEEVDLNTQATVYSHCARLTIQKLLFPRMTGKLDDLIWVSEKGWTEPSEYIVDLINEPIFNKAVWELGDGPSFYSAEINVKGKVMYGYNWDLNKVYDVSGSVPSAAGDYRVTFSFDDYCGLNNQGPPLNTFFTDADGKPVTLIIEEMLVPTTFSITGSESESGGTVGATAVIDYKYNLTYMDIRIESKK